MVNVDELIRDIQSGRIQIQYFEEDPEERCAGFTSEVSKEEKHTILTALIESVPVQDRKPPLIMFAGPEALEGPAT